MIHKIVEEVISNAHQNGFESEIESMDDLELAIDFLDCGVFSLDDYSIDEMKKAITKFRRKHTL